MWNLRSLKMSVMLVASGVALVAALPAKAQQVILTPAGTMFQPTMMPGTEIGGGQPAPAPIALDPSLPSYDILTPEQLKPGKIIFRGIPVEILAPDDPRISDEARGYIAPPDGVWVIQEVMPGVTSTPGKISAAFFLAPPRTMIAIDPSLPSYDSLRPEQIKPGKFNFRGKPIEILAPDDPRISAEKKANAAPDEIWVIQEYMPGFTSIQQFSPVTFLAPPSTISPIVWNGTVQIGEKVPYAAIGMMQGEVVILANNDPRIPAEFQSLDTGKSRFWAIDSRAIDPTIPVTWFKPFLVSPAYYGVVDAQIPTKDALVSIVQKENADRAAQDFLASPIVAEARREQLRIILSNPEIYSSNIGTWGKPVKDVVDAQGNVVLSKQQIIDARIGYAKFQLAGGDDGSFLRTAEWTIGDQYNALGYIPETIDQLWNGKIQFPELQDTAKFYQKIITDRGIVADQLGSPLSGGTGNVTTQGAFESLSLSGASVPLAGTGATSFSAATASGSSGSSGSGEIQVSALSSPLTVFPTVSQPVIANQIASPVTSVTVQASQNPSADFATTRSAPRNPVPEQLNRGVVDSPLSNSRIFPGMR